MKLNRNHTFLLGVILLSLSFILSKLFFFALPWAATIGKMGRGIFRECMIVLNLWLGYRLLPTDDFKQRFLRWGIALEVCFLCAVAVYANLDYPNEFVTQIQVMFRELLLSPIYFVLFYFAFVQKQPGRF